MSDQQQDVNKEETKALILKSYQEEDNLKKILITQQHLNQVKESLSAIIESMGKEQSLFTRASTFWGNLAFWQKIIGGVVLTVPTLAAGIATHLGFLLAISGVTVAIYAAGGIVLDDHHSYSKKIIDNLKAGIFYLADILCITISALDKIRADLAEEINKFRIQNDKLTQNVTELGDKIGSLTAQVEVFTATEQLLRETQEKLEQNAKHLQETVIDNEELLQKTQTELAHVKKDYEQSRLQLNEKVAELAAVKDSMTAELEKSKEVAAALDVTVKTLSGTVIKDAKQRQIFQEKIDNIIQNGEKGFVMVNERIQELEKELAKVKDELEQSNNRHQALLDRQDIQVHQLTQIGITATKLKQVEEELKESNKKYADLLAHTTFSAQSKPSDMAPLTSPTQGLHVYGIHAKDRVNKIQNTLETTMQPALA